LDKKKLDILMVDRGLAKSRTFAQDLIRNGNVQIQANSNYKTITKPSTLIDVGVEIRIHGNSELLKYVSRGGLKLEGALSFLGLNVHGLNCLDVGLSTGGFSDCLIQAGAERVVGIDVGRNQLDPRLLSNVKLMTIEQVNARNMSTNEDLRKLTPKNGFDLVVMDVSFISIELIFAEIQKVLNEKGLLLSLVKPQFEVGPENLNKGGVVKNELLFQAVQQKIIQKLNELEFSVINYFPSAIEGKDGNKEFFVFAKKS
jgi:23S rRNA (cytidine1920-2'-O)/16S rRNA (cytidine1409-2'-O)-methyltransferase